MSNISKAALDYMEQKDVALKCSNFKNTVEVLHGDGSHFIYQNAILKIKKFSNIEMLLIWTEHCGCHVFFFDDVTLYREYKPL